ncbi:MAG TPA: VTT domain-containing protein [Vicinamibacteria bacterium]|nr:VTT domain-containing protein [Vicinamibacteria bacterium]
MSGPVSFVLHHPYLVLFGVVLAEQLGLPVPATPFLLGAGALVGMNKLHPVSALACAVLASLLADLTWYEAGRRRGSSILKLLCRISLEPDSCVRRTEDVFAKQGARTLLFAKFLPGLNTVAPPMAGMIGMPLSRFLLWDALGALLWSGAYFLVGLAFADQIETVAERAAAYGGRLVVGLLTVFALWLLYKYAQRQRFIRSLRVARITPLEVKQRMDAGEPLVVVDLRGPLDFELEPQRVPGALRLSASDLETRHHEIPRDRDVVLYCT